MGKRCRSVWADTEHPIHWRFTVAKMWKLEKGYLMSMTAPFDGYMERLARISSTCQVATARNRYSVPCEWAGHIVSTWVYPSRIDVATANAVVASHTQLAGSGQTSYDWQHYTELVQRKPGALRNDTPFMDLPTPSGKTGSARPIWTVRRLIMRNTTIDVQAQSKVLRLGGIATAWADLTEQGGNNQPWAHHAGWWCICCRPKMPRAMRSIAHHSTRRMRRTCC